MKLEGIRALVVGMEKSGRAAFAFLHARGADVTATDLKPQDVAGFRLQTDDLFDEAVGPDRAVARRAAGSARDRARHGARRECDRRNGTGCALSAGPVIGITGSNGKTTTTSLVGHILRSARTPVQVGGNIGTPVIAMTETSRAGPVECSRTVEFSARDDPTRSAPTSAYA